MFSGSHSINMDAKGRLAIPARFREALATACGGRLVITADFRERCLLVYPEPEWLEIAEKINKLPNITKAERRIQRRVIGNAQEQDMDANGRIVVPPTLRSFAGLEKKLMLVGQGKKLELWSEPLWFEMLDESDDEEDMSAELLAITL